MGCARRNDFVGVCKSLACTAQEIGFQIHNAPEVPREHQGQRLLSHKSMASGTGCVPRMPVSALVANRSQFGELTQQRVVTQDTCQNVGT